MGPEGELDHAKVARGRLTDGNTQYMDKYSIVASHRHR